MPLEQAYKEVLAPIRFDYTSMRNANSKNPKSGKKEQYRHFFDSKV